MNKRQVVFASVDAVVNSTAFICNVTFENHLTPCRVLVEHPEGDPIPTNFAVLKAMVEASPGALSEIVIDGCDFYMSDTTRYITDEVEL